MRKRIAKSLSKDQVEFLDAISKYKTDNDKLFLSWTEVLMLVKRLGYKKEGGQ